MLVSLLAEMHSTAQHELALAIVHKIISGTVSFVGDGGELSFSTIVSVMEFIASQFRRFIGLSTFAIPADDVQSASNVVDAGNDVGLGLGLDLLRIFTTELQLHSSALKYFLR